jgi:hypothetical protein
MVGRASARAVLSSTARLRLLRLFVARVFPFFPRQVSGFRFQFASLALSFVPSFLCCSTAFRFVSTKNQKLKT